MVYTSDGTKRKGATGLQVPLFSKGLMAQPSLRVREAPDTTASACQVLGFFFVRGTECRNARVSLHICSMQRRE